MKELETIAHRAKEVLGSKLADLNDIEAKSFYDLENWFRNKITTEANQKLNKPSEKRKREWFVTVSINADEYRTANSVQAFKAKLVDDHHVEADGVLIYFGDEICLFEKGKFVNNL